MATLKIKNADGDAIYMNVSGDGTTSIPYNSISGDFLTEVQKGNVAGHSIVQKFGRNPLTGTSFVPITSIGVYRTPQVAGATTLRVKAGGNANDTAAGSGAQEITLQGLDETGAEVTEILATAGVSASLSTTATFIRFYRAWVSKSGSYADMVTPSHTATITIEDTASTQDWGTIDLNGFASSQTYIGAYTIPLGKKGYLLSGKLRLDTTKVVDGIFFKRENILETVAPYTAMRAMLELTGLDSLGYQFDPKSSGGALPALTDIGFMAKVATGTADVSVEMEILLVDE